MSGLTPPKRNLADEWTQRYDKANDLARNVQDNLQVRSRCPTGLPALQLTTPRGRTLPRPRGRPPQERAQLTRQGQHPAKLNAAVRHDLGILSTEIDALESLLDSLACSTLTKQEKSRRRDLLSVLRMRRGQMGKGLSEAPRSSERDLLMPGASAPSTSAAPRETAETVDRDADGMLRLQDRLLAEQDEELGMLGEHVGRVKNVAMTINAELEEQNRILGDLDDETNAVHGRLRVARRQVASVLKRGSNWRLVLVTLSLIGVLVYLVAELLKH